MTPPFQPPPSPDRAALAAQLRATADLIENDPGTCTIGELTHIVLALIALLGRLEAVLTIFTGAWDAHGAWAFDAARSGGAWLTARTELAKSHATKLVHHGRDLSHCPHTRAAWLAGTIGSDKASMLLRARPTHPDRFTTDEPVLVDTIAPLTVAQARIVIDHWIALAEAERTSGDDGEPVDPPAEPHSKVRLSKTLGGRHLGDLDLTAEDGNTLADAMAERVDTAFREGRFSPDDGLTPAERNAIALMELACAGANPNATLHGAPRPSVSVTIDAPTPHTDPTDLAHQLDQRCHYTDGSHAHPTTVERLLCTARITAILRHLKDDGTIEVLGVTDIKRHPTARQRAALDERDRGCVFPGCHAPPTWCDAHHLIPHHPPDGPTLMSNLALVCRFHHHAIHEGGWTLQRDPTTQRLTLTDPNGHERDLPPPGHKIQGPDDA